MSIFGNTIEQFVINASIGLLTLIVAIAIPVFIYRRQKNNKDISYEIISDVPILNIDKTIKSRIQVMMDNTSIDHARLIILRIWNAGNMPILSEEFDKNEPIRFIFVGDVNILEAEVVKTEPSNIKSRTSLKWSQKTLSLEPLLLNSKDSIEMKIVTSGQYLHLLADARVIGVSQIRLANNPTTRAYKASRFWILMWVIMLALYGFAASIIVIFNDSPSHGKLVSFVIGFVIAAILYRIYYHSNRYLNIRRGRRSPKSQL